MANIKKINVFGETIVETEISVLAGMHVANKWGECEKISMAECAWDCLRGGRRQWTHEVSNAKPYGKYYSKKYFLSRIPYTTKMTNMNWSESVINLVGHTNKKIKDVITQDHYIGSYTVGECALDNKEIYLEDGTFEKFAYELYPYTFLTNYVTCEENNALSKLKGICSTDEKYERAGIRLYNQYNVECLNPLMPEEFTKWEQIKYGI